MMLPYIRQMFQKRVMAILCVIILTTGTFLYSTNISGIKIEQNEFRLNFIRENYKRCQDIVQKRSISGGIQLSSMNQLKKREFEEAIRNATGTKIIVGHSEQVMGQYLIMHHLAGQPSVKVICESGFDLGHSSFNYLTANENAIVHSFDLGKHVHVHQMSDYLKKLFPKRFFIHFGDSTITIPKFTRDNPEIQCDLMLVDGGHVYPVALADIKNFAKIANLEENIMAFDDYPTDWGKRFGKAWEDVRKEGTLKELMRCTFQPPDDLQRGFTLGRISRKPTEDEITASKS